MTVNINEKGVMTVSAENKNDRQKLLDWIALNHNAIYNYSIDVDIDYEKPELTNQ